MVKVHINLTVDNDILEKVRTLYPNQISKVVNEYFNSLVNSSKKDIDSIQINIERLKLIEESKQLSKIQISIKEREQLIQEYENKQAKLKEAELIKQKKILELEVSCSSCGKKEAKPYKINENTNLCKTCFMGR